MRALVEFRAGVNGDHTCEPLCLAGVDAGDRGVRKRAADERCVQPALGLDVSDELPRAGQKAVVLDPRDRLANKTESRSLGGHHLPPCISSTAVSTPATID